MSRARPAGAKHDAGRAAKRSRPRQAARALSPVPRGGSAPLSKGGSARRAHAVALVGGAHLRHPRGVRGTRPRLSAFRGRAWLTYPELDLPGVLHGIVVFKELRPGLPHQDWAKAVRDHLWRDCVIAGMPLVIPQQVHGARIGLVAEAPVRDLVVDGLVTDLPGVAIAISVADCLPLLAFNRESAVIGVAHCGWRSIAAGIVEELVGNLRTLSRDAGNARFVVGAGIGACCYQVRDDLLGKFTPDEVRRFSCVEAGAIRFDLKKTVAARLARCGIAPTDISVDKTCTSCKKDVLSSYRADPAGCGRMVAFMALAGRREEACRARAPAGRRVSREVTP